MSTIDLKHIREQARGLFLTGIHAVDAYESTKQSMSVDGNRLFIRNRDGQQAQFDMEACRRIYLIGFGKAAGPMARAVEDALQDRITNGIIVVPYGNQVELSHSQIIQAAHPLPDTQSQNGARQIIGLVLQADERDMVICLLSGGGSSLCCLPHAGITIEDMAVLNQLLLESGASIHEINTIRKHVSQIKGGHLARSIYPATTVTLMISDVIADRLDSIASGPTVPDPTTFKQAYAVLEKYRLAKSIPPNIHRLIEAGANGEVLETPKENDPAFRKTSNYIVARNMDALRAIRQQAERMGYRTLILTSRLQGDVTEVARTFGAMIKELIPVAQSQGPLCIITGGEMTVRVVGMGKGGRNCHFGLSLVPLISGQTGTVVLSAGTDGTDGPTDAAGVIVDHTTFAKLYGMGLDHRIALMDYDSYTLFQKSGDLLQTGPTGTNVMDVQLVLIDPNCASNRHGTSEK